MIIEEDLGIEEYCKVWEYQEKLFEKTIQNKLAQQPTENRLLICEHPHVITIGKSGKDENLLFAEEFLKEKGVSLFKINRGGDVTYHGPGQIVAYPIFDLETLGIGLRQYICNLEEIMIQFLALYGIKAGRSEGATGIWLDTDNPKKIRKAGAIGVRSSRYVTMHGFALNVNTDMSYFSLINPCGFVDRGVTSLEAEIGKKIDMQVAKSQIVELFHKIFDTEKASCNTNS